MELLTGPLISPTGGDFMLVPVRSLMDLLKLEVASDHFALLTMLNCSELTDEAMFRVAEALKQKGLAYACCFGEDCERWHDGIDAADIHRLKTLAAPMDGLVMTTWHANDSVEEALFSSPNVQYPMKHTTQTAVIT